jgi:hypothetical protein
MDRILPWDRLVAAIKPFATERSVYSVELLLRIYCLQQWYNLNDRFGCFLGWRKHRA